jgi:hypothetical protein
MVIEAHVMVCSDRKFRIGLPELFSLLKITKFIKSKTQKFVLPLHKIYFPCQNYGSGNPRLL